MARCPHCRAALAAEVNGALTSDANAAEAHHPSVRQCLLSRNRPDPAVRWCSVQLWRGVEQDEFSSIGRLELACPPVEVGVTYRVTVPGWLRVPGLDPPPEFAGRRVEEVQLDADAKATSHGAHLVAFDPRPKPKIENDAQTETQDFLREAPEFMLDPFSGRLIPRAGAEGCEPLILREAYGASLHGKLLREGGLARPGQPAGEYQSGLGHRSQSSSHNSPSWVIDHPSVR